MTIKITDNSRMAVDELRTAAVRSLEKCGLVGEGYAKKLCPVDTGNLRNSITHVVDVAELLCRIGSNSEYSIFVECGTGIYYPGGRQTPWFYVDAQGKGHLTHGQRAQPYLKPAVADNVSTYKTIIQDELKG